MSQVASPSGSAHIATVPLWVKLVLRPISLIIGICVLGIGAALVDAAGSSVDQYNLAVVCGVFTLVGFAYVMATTIVPGLQKLYHVFAVVGVDALLLILWFSDMCAMAAWRNNFDRDGIDGFFFIQNKYLSMMTAVAVLSAFQCVVFALILLFTCVAAARQGLFTLGSSSAPKPAAMEMGASPGHAAEKPEGPYQVPANPVPANPVYPAPGDAYNPTAQRADAPTPIPMPDARY